MRIASVNGKPIDQEPFTYARPGENGWELCAEAEAAAMVVDGDLYALSEDTTVTRPPLYDDEGQLIDPAPAAPVVHIYDDPHPTLDLAQTSDAHTEQITDLETGLVDQTLTTEERIALIEQALCELALA